MQLREINFIVFKTKLINHTTSVFNVKTTFSFPEYILDFQKGSNSTNAYTATVH